MLAIRNDAVRHQLDRILASPGFRRAEKLSAMLRFLVEETLAGRSNELKEYTIGVRVLERGDDFNPQIDPIVRVQARNLRNRLEEYYRTSGSEDSPVIGLEKGSYVPIFLPRLDNSASPPRALPIAVLPFANLSGDRDIEYFADGITEDLISALARQPELAVIARTSSFVFKAAGSFDSRSIGARLGVDFLVEGSLRREPGRIRINANLVEAANGHVRWSKAYDTALPEAANLAQLIAAEICEAVLAGKRPRTPQGSCIFAAYELYLQARAQWQLRTREGIAKAEACYKRAIEIDPRFAAAYAGLADCYTMLSVYGHLTGVQMERLARPAAEMALRLDPECCQALTTSGMIAATFDWDYEAAEKFFLRAIELQPSYSDARQWYSTLFLCTMRRLEEAAEQLALALRSDPLSVVIVGDLANTLSLAGRHLEALKHGELAIDKAPKFFRLYWQVGLIYERMGRLDEAIVAFEKCRSLCAGEVFEQNAIGSLGHAFAVAGRVQDAMNCLRALQDLSQGRVANPVSHALIYTGLNDRDRAFEWLNIAADHKIAPVIWTWVDPRSTPLRDDPRFNTLMVRLGISD